MRWTASISKTHQALVFTVLALAPLQCTTAKGLLETIDQEVTALYYQSKDAIIKVHARGLSSVPEGNRERIIHRVGTGFFIDEDGYFLTSASIVDNSKTSWIEWNGRRVVAELIGCDPLTNVALLKVNPNRCEAPNGKTPSLSLGNSDNLRVGSMVIAVGFPYNLPSTPSLGIVSGFDIRRGNRLFATRHMRADCKLLRGQAGGPVFSPGGDVVGMVVASYLEDQCYALPINAAKKVYTELKQVGCAQHAWVGLQVAERRLVGNVRTQNRTQVYVQEVLPETPAAEAGFITQDILVSIDTNRVSNLADVLDKMFYFRKGDSVTFMVLRDGVPRQLTLHVDERPQAKTAGIASPRQKRLRVRKNQISPAIPASRNEPAN